VPAILITAKIKSTVAGSTGLKTGQYGNRDDSNTYTIAGRNVRSLIKKLPVLNETNNEAIMSTITREISCGNSDEEPIAETTNSDIGIGYREVPKV
jgi:hypothetical protein